ncbi:MAG: DinB family protein [Bacteroidota bacterium]
MKETTRIKELVDDLYDGHPWLDVTILNTLRPLSATQAAKKIQGNGNSIWEILNHLVAWRFAVLERVKGNTLNSPADNFFHPITDSSDKAWQETLAKLEASQEAWRNFLDNFNEADFEATYPSNNLSYYKHIHGIIQHDAYHLGQIVLLAKAG